MGEDEEAAADCWLWWRESMSSTHNESRLAACPLSGIPGAFAPLSTNTRASLKIFGFVGHVGRGRQQIGGGASAIAGDLCQRDQCLVPHPFGSVLGHLVI